MWNIRHGKEVLVKDLIEVAAPITFGAFSPDYTKLVIGDGSGRVYLLALEEEDGDEDESEDADSDECDPNSEGFPFSNRCHGSLIFVIFWLFLQPHTLVCCIISSQLNISIITRLLNPTHCQDKSQLEEEGRTQLSRRQQRASLDGRRSASSATA